VPDLGKWCKGEVPPLFRKTRYGHYVAFGRACSGRLLVVVFEKREKGLVRLMTGWDMSVSERNYYLREINFIPDLDPPMAG
jgi:hypothetical protein